MQEGKIVVCYSATVNSVNLTAIISFSRSAENISRSFISNYTGYGDKETGSTILVDLDDTVKLRMILAVS
jgi:hypothetical protein